ncbi:MAG: hypothetical protein HC778_01820, partial [Chamaesiphon sp. CSU_1_12]|nr:hypothetical protein [Chamaesiphon sp. CSU_1_12]
YEAFIRAYPNAADAPQVRLLLGLVCHRHLHDAPRAAGHLQAAFEQLTQPDQRRLAEAELEAIARSTDASVNL